MTAAAISTPPAAGGIGMIRVSGEDAICITEKIFKSHTGKKISEMKGYTAALGAVYDGGEPIDETVVIVYRAPRSYTGEDVTEICCHGGLYVTQRVLRAVLSAGAEPAGPGEFTKRAFLNGKLDLTEAESVMSIVSAQGQAALTAARNTLEGSLSKKADEVTSRLLTVNASLAVWADYPDDDVPGVSDSELTASLSACRDELRALIKSCDGGRAVTEGIRTAICGKPNVGKSTLMNSLAGCRKSIVTPFAGTTRDVVEETVRLGDVVLRLADTAGIHSSDDTVESIGIELAKQTVADAELVLAVFDLSRPADESDAELIRLCEGKKSVAVLNKADLEPVFSEDALGGVFTRTVRLSANDSGCPDVLASAVEEILGVGGLDFTAAMLTNERQLSCVRSAERHVSQAIDNIAGGMTLDVVNINIDSALAKLYELTGKSVSEQTVNEIFSRFCVGK